MKRHFQVLFFLFLFTSIHSVALAQPSLPTVVRGRIKINDEGAPVGTEIKAKIGNEVIGTTSVPREGRYIMDIKANSSMEGKEVNFYVDSIQANSTIEYEMGEVKVLDLSVERDSGYYQGIINKLTGNVIEGGNTLFYVGFIVLSVFTLGFLRFRKR